MSTQTTKVNTQATKAIVATAKTLAAQAKAAVNVPATTAPVVAVNAPVAQTNATAKPIITARGSSAPALSEAQLTAITTATANMQTAYAGGFGSSAVRPKSPKPTSLCGVAWALTLAAHDVLGTHASGKQLSQLAAHMGLNASNVTQEASTCKRHFAQLSTAKASTVPTA